MVRRQGFMYQFWVQFTEDGPWSMLGFHDSEDVAFSHKDGLDGWWDYKVVSVEIVGY